MCDTDTVMGRSDGDNHAQNAEGEPETHENGTHSRTHRQINQPRIAWGRLGGACFSAAVFGGFTESL